MQKYVQFDFNTLHDLIVNYIRGQLGYTHGNLTVDFPAANRTVRIWTVTPCSYCWESKCISYLLGCFTLGLYCCIMQCVRSSHEQKEVCSFWRIDYSPYQVFHECVKSQLRVSGTCSSV
jgi:hypothetical protein